MFDGSDPTEKVSAHAQIVPLQDMALHFQTDIETMRPLLAVWIEKGQGAAASRLAAPCKGCCQCDPATIEVYEWIE
jgi:putative ferrous iron transport protein C